MRPTFWRAERMFAIPERVINPFSSFSHRIFFRRSSNWKIYFLEIRFAIFPTWDIQLGPVTHNTIQHWSNCLMSLLKSAYFYYIIILKIMDIRCRMSYSPPIKTSTMYIYLYLIEINLTMQPRKMVGERTYGHSRDHTSNETWNTWNASYLCQLVRFILHATVVSKKEYSSKVERRERKKNACHSCNNIPMYGLQPPMQFLWRKTKNFFWLLTQAGVHAERRIIFSYIYYIDIYMYVPLSFSNGTQFASSPVGRKSPHTVMRHRTKLMVNLPYNNPSFPREN